MLSFLRRRRRAADPPAVRAADPPSAVIALPRPEPGAAAAVPIRKVLGAHDTVMRFAQWMREWEYTGWYADSDIVDAYRIFCDEARLEEIDHYVLLEGFASAPGVRRDRRRLNATADKALLRIKARLAGQPGKNQNRPTLYRVASPEEIAETRRPRHRRGDPARSAAAAVPQTSRGDPVRSAAAAVPPTSRGRQAAAAGSAKMKRAA